jgi:hypothetical protein
MGQNSAEFVCGWMVQSFDVLIQNFPPEIAKYTNMREAITLPQGLSITLYHLAAGFGFEDLIVPWISINWTHVYCPADRRELNEYRAILPTEYSSLNTLSGIFE